MESQGSKLKLEMPYSAGLQLGTGVD